MRTPKLLKPIEVAEMLSIPATTLRYWRCIGAGPNWLKLEGTIRYDLADVLLYIEESRRSPSVRAHVEEHDGAL